MVRANDRLMESDGVREEEGVGTVAETLKSGLRRVFQWEVEDSRMGPGVRLGNENSLRVTTPEGLQGLRLCESLYHMSLSL